MAYTTPPTFNAGAPPPLSAANLNTYLRDNFADHQGRIVALESSSGATVNTYWRNAVRVATTGNITLSGTQTVDSIALVVGDRVLVKDQTTASQNGIYDVAAGAWARSADADTSAKVPPSMVTSVQSGTVNQDTIWMLTNDSVTLGSTALTFAKIQVTVNAAAGSVSFTPSGGISATNVQAALVELDGDKANATHAHAGTDITTGTVPVARLGTGTLSSSTFLSGTGAFATPASSSPFGGSVNREYQFYTPASTEKILFARNERIVGSVSSGSGFVSFKRKSVAGDTTDVELPQSFAYGEELHIVTSGVTSDLLVTLYGVALSDFGAPPEAAAGALQTMVTAASAGSTITLERKVYREKPIVNKALTIQGVPGTTIKGSDIWTSFTGSGPYTSTQTVPALPTRSDFQTYYNANTGTNSVETTRPEMVFLDNVELTQVAVGVTPTTGQFALNGSRNIIMGDNPAGRVVEVVTRDRWFQIDSPNVTLDTMAMHHCGSSFSDGAVNAYYSNIKFLNIVASHGHSGFVSTNTGASMEVKNCRLYRFGEVGISSYATALTIWDNEIYECLYKGGDPYWLGGGMKLVNAPSSSVQRNNVHHNFGTGIWFDIECHSTYAAYNRSHHNDALGIFYEISDTAVLEYNVCYWNKDVGIGIRNSATTEARFNIAAFNQYLIPTNARCVDIIEADRSPYTAHDINFHHNDIITTLPIWLIAWWQHATGVLDTSGANNQGHDNRYYVTGEPAENGSFTRFQAGNALNTHSLATFNGTRFEEAGTYLTGAQYTALIAANKIPTSL